MTNLKLFPVLIVLLLLLSSCFPEAPATQEPTGEAPPITVVPALSTVAPEIEPTAESVDEIEEAAVASPTATLEPEILPTATVAGEYPPAPSVVEDSYPAQPVDAVEAREAAGGYPAENEEMADEPTEADAHVTFVKATEAADGSWSFEVTVEHLDTGWEDYANGWDVITTQGQVLKVDANDPFTRLLLHPHETEQPFTRSQSGLFLPSDVTELFVRAHDIVHGWGGAIIFVDLNTTEGEGYEVVRYEE